MKLALALCVAFLSVAFAQDEDGDPELGVGEEEVSPPNSEEPKIAGGLPATRNDFPYVAYIQSGEGAEDIHNCVGSLITSNAVLTSGWCVRGFNKHTIRLGSVYRTAEDGNAWTVVSTWSMVHPDYKPPELSSNVGVVFLPKKAPLNTFIKVAELPKATYVGSFVGVHAYISGWGQTSEGSALSEILHYAEVTVLPNDICQQYFPDEFVADSTMCAGEQHVMDGDDGSPLVVTGKDRFLQIGIHTRRVRSDFNNTRAAIYERLTFYTEWIINVTSLQE